MMHPLPSRLFAATLALSLATSLWLPLTSAAQLSESPGLEADASAPMLEADPAVKGPVQARAVVVDIVSNTLDFDEKTGLYVATGDVKVIVSEQNTELTAKKVTYNPTKELVVAEGDVVITDGPEKVYGTYAKIDLTRESALINDPITVLDQVRIKAREGFKDGKYTRLVDGKLVIPGQKDTVKNDDANFGDDINSVDPSKLALADPFMTRARENGTTKKGHAQVNTGNPNEYGNGRVLEELDMRWDEPDDSGGSFKSMRWHADTVDIVRHADYDDINLQWPSLQYKGMTVARLPQMDFAQTNYDDLEYLGPDIGFDPDNGGFYAGPGFDFKAGKGFVRFSPYLSAGVGRRRARGGQELETASGIGGGAMVHYMSERSNAWAGYNFLIGTPVAYWNRKIGDGKTRLVLASNEDYNHGLMGWERPKYIAQLTDTRVLKEWGKFSLKSFASAGVAKDEFFPTNQEDFFVEKPDAEPVSAGRAQLQLQIGNNQPLLRFGDVHNNFALGVVGQVGMNAYTTGDFYGVFRAGPRIQMRLFDRVSSITQYWAGQTTGESPFVFDQYYSGRNAVQTTNQVRVNKYLSLGMRTQLSLNSDNAKGDMLIGNALYVLFGPDDVKFNLAYDVVRQRSFFGINFMPGKNRKTLYYDQMNIQDQMDYNGPPPMTPAIPTAQGNAIDAFGNVRDVGMMNGNKAN